MDKYQFILRRASKLMEVASADYAYGYLRGCLDANWINPDEYQDLLASIRNESVFYEEDDEW